MAPRESPSISIPNGRTVPPSPATTSHLDINNKETLDQARGSVDHKDTSTPVSRFAMDSEGNKQLGPDMQTGGDEGSLPTAPRAQQNKEGPQNGLKLAKRSQSFPLQEAHPKDLQPDRPHISTEHCARIETENKQLRKQLGDNRTALSDFQKSLAESKAKQAFLHQRLDEATATIFRLRPQRKEPTESEIEQDYHTLSESIKSWVEENCIEFLEDDYHGFEIMRDHPTNLDQRPQGVESILRKFQSNSPDLMEVKEHVLSAIIMRYLFERILTRPLSILLNGDEEGFLNAIYEGMGNMNPPKDLPTIRTWKSDTATTIDSHRHFGSRSRDIEDRQTRELYDYLRNAVPKQHDGRNVMNSIYRGIVSPAMALARKIQSASSIWEFKYSEWWNCQPGELMSQVPNFLAIIEDYRCINLSAHAKQLKLATDLATFKQQRSLIYLLDIFPGLYCQRVTTSGAQPIASISQPVLLVTFISEKSRQGPGLPGSSVMRDDQTKVSARPLGRNLRDSDNVGHRQTNNIRSPVPAPLPERSDEIHFTMANNVPGDVVDRIDHRVYPNDRIGFVEDGDMMDSKMEESFRLQPQSRKDEADRMDSRGRGRGAQRQQPIQPASQGETYFSRWKVW